MRHEYRKGRYQGLLCHKQQVSVGNQYTKVIMSQRMTLFCLHCDPGQSFACAWCVRRLKKPAMILRPIFLQVTGLENRGSRSYQCLCIARPVNLCPSIVLPKGEKLLGHCLSAANRSSGHPLNRCQHPSTGSKKNGLACKKKRKVGLLT